MVTLAIERLMADPPSWLQGKRLALLCNQSSTDSRLRHSRHLLAATFPGQLSCIFAPQHGFMAEKQDNMIESAHGLDPELGVPIFSLYGEQRKPTPEMMEQLDVLLVDMVDVGTRVYTFMYTLAYCLQAAAEAGKAVLILDRPNPIGGEAVEGNILADDVRSFVGLYPLPMRHGLTFAELGLLFNNHFGIGAELHVLPVQGWRRQDHYPLCGLPWVFPSPNMPSYQTALVYPGQVIWEGTNVSEGRGTTLPFELCGAPYIDSDLVLEKLAAYELPGCLWRPLCFEPTFHKWAGQCCQGFQLHVTDVLQFKPYRTSLALLQVLLRHYPEQFAFKEPPYEYEFHKRPLDLILGSSSLCDELAQGRPLAELEEQWQPGLTEFDQLRQGVMLYE